MVKFLQESWEKLREKLEKKSIFLFFMSNLQNFREIYRVKKVFTAGPSLHASLQRNQSHRAAYEWFERKLSKEQTEEKLGESSAISNKNILLPKSCLRKIFGIASQVRYCVG